MIYDFLNKDTQEVIEVSLRLSEYDEFLANNPNLERYFGNQVLKIGDPVRLGLRKHDNGFREVLAKVQERTAGASLDIK